MVFFSPATKEITAKIVYYGPGMCGKTTNLQKVHELMRPQMRSDLVSVATETDRTIYFDFLPLKLGKIAGFDFAVRTFTVPGQPYYAETRKMVLQGADGVVFVADSQRYMLDQNKDSLSDLKRNLKANGLVYRDIPLVIQYNKRDLPDILPVSDLEAALNDRKVQSFSAAAIRGAGVVETLRAVTLMVFKTVRDGGLTGGATAPAVATAATDRSQSETRGPPSTNTAPSPGPAGPGGSPQRVFSPQPTDQLPRPPGPDAAGVQPGAALSAQSRAAQKASPQHQTNLSDQVGQLVAQADEGSPVMPSKEDIGHQEFQNLAVLHHKLQERVAQMEKELNRLTQEHQDLKRLVGKKLL